MDPTGYFESQKVLSFLIENQERFSMPRANTADKTVNTPSFASPSKSKEPKPLEGFMKLIQNKGFNNIRSKRQAVTEQICPSTNQSHRASTIYSIAAGSWSGSGIESIVVVDIEEPAHQEVSLRRSRTAPTRRNKFGSHEPQQIVHVNRASSQSKLKFSLINFFPIRCFM
jgi:hypothetical protein